MFRRRACRSELLGVAPCALQCSNVAIACLTPRLYERAGGPIGVGGVEFFTQSRLAVALRRRQAAACHGPVVGGGLDLVVVVAETDAAGARIAPPGIHDDVLAEVFQQLRIPLTILKHRLPSTAMRVLVPRDWRQHGAKVAAEVDDFRQSPGAQLLQQPGAFSEHLLVLAVPGHCQHRCCDAAACLALMQGLLLSCQREQGPGAYALQLDIRPVPAHRLDDCEHSPVLVLQEAGAKPGDDEHALREDVCADRMPSHEHFENLEHLAGHAVIEQDLAQGRQQSQALDLDSRILPEEPHVDQHALESLEGPHLRHILTEDHDAWPMRGQFACTVVHPAQHLCAVQLNLRFLWVVLQGEDEVGGEIVLQKAINTSGIVASEVADDADALADHRFIIVEPPRQRKDPLHGFVRPKSQAPFDVLVRVVQEHQQSRPQIRRPGDRTLQLVQQLLRGEPRKLPLLRQHVASGALVDTHDLTAHAGHLHAHLGIPDVCLAHGQSLHQRLQALRHLARLSYLPVDDESRGGAHLTAEPRQHREDVRVPAQRMLRIGEDRDETL
mmetsp:Transcript_108563/g.346522  ORF Transcript_108563/g.346522 Transcript_108563/m.346522 type:complete len:554 (-) Transcript_108563:1653-3314(-)